MRIRNSAVLTLLLMAACSSDAAGPASTASALLGREHTLLAGRVVGFMADPDSTVVPVRGAEIIVYRVDSIPVDTVPVDTVPVDTVPPDTMLWSGLVLRRMLPNFGYLDSIPVDTIPPDTIPVDTIPPDSNPPPPPPPGCGRTGEVVARVVTREGGRFKILGLAPAIYDLRITPPKGTPFGRRFYCGVRVPEGQPVELTIFTFLRRGED
jgi:hypothetical protein